MTQLQVYQSWLPTVLGKGIDVDKAYGDQCVDVVLDYGEACFPGVGWQTLFPPVPNAKQLFADANPAYFQAIANNHNDPNQLPEIGDVMVFDATPQAGYSNQLNNPAGHTGVCAGAGPDGYNLVMQDGSNPNGTTFIKYSPWKYRPCIGWLRPKLVQAPQPPVVGPPAPSNGETLFLPSSVQKWRVYAVTGPWAPGHEVAFLWPSKFPPGLTYPIQKVVATNVYQIKTQDFGTVAIYAGPDTDAVITNA